MPQPRQAGGGDDNAPAPVTPQPVATNDAPVITSSAAITVDENTLEVFTSSATDANSDSIAFSLTGTDAAQFTIDSSTGAIAFAAPPDFEAPADAGADNIFDITLNASDGTDITTQDVAVTLANVNEAPVFTSAEAVSAGENQNTVLTAVAADPDNGDVLTYSLSGTDAALFAIDANTGVITFANAPDFETPSDADGDNVFDLVVNVSDGTNTASQDLIVTLADTIEGTPGDDDNLLGTGLDDTITGFAGNDTLFGLDGDDVLIGGLGADGILGENGDDLIIADFSDVILDGGMGIDTLDFSTTPDPGSVIFNFSDGLTFEGSRIDLGNASVVTGTNLVFIPDFENVTGSQFNDVIFGTNESNILEGQAGDDVINGRSGDDLILGGDGDDTLVYGSSAGNNTLDGGAGNDRALVLFPVDDITVIDNQDGTLTVNVASIGTSSLLSNIETIQDENFNIIPSSEFLIASLGATNGADELVGTEQRDFIDGLDGDDILTGGLGADVINGGAGNDIIFTDGSDQLLDGGVGIDTLDLSVSTTPGTVDPNFLLGINIEDEFGVNIGSVNVIDLDFGDLVVSGNDSHTILGFENVIGTDFSDLIFGELGTNDLNGGNGNDAIFGMLGDDVIFGGAGADVLIGNEGDDIIDGGVGIDAAVFIDSAEDITIVNNGNGTLTVTTVTEGVDTLSNIEFIFDGLGIEVPIPDAPVVMASIDPFVSSEVEDEVTVSESLDAGFDETFIGTIDIQEDMVFIAPDVFEIA